MIVYVDASALVKRYVLESGSKDVNALLEQAETVGSAALTRVEMASALAKAARMDWVNTEEAQTTWQDFLSHWPAFVRLALTDRASRLAGDSRNAGHPGNLRPRTMAGGPENRLVGLA
jgi:predicted nucleic acid-binding protein